MKNKNFKFIPTLLAIACVAAVTVALLVFAFNAEVESAYTPTITADVAEGETVNLLEGNILDFATNYQKLDSVGKYDWLDCFAPVPAKLTWNCDEDALYYTVNISRNKDMTDAESYIAYDKYVEIPDLFMGTHYFYQIEAKYSDSIVKSQIFDFNTAYLPRTISIDGVSNTRDIGGYNAGEDKRVKQGMIFRGGTPQSITEAGVAKAAAAYGINTQIDLSGGESVKASSFGEDVTFLSVSAPYYVGNSGIQQESFRAALVTALKVFTDEANYPVYIHCSLGRDRTGTLSFLLNALCGVGEMDLFMDYETAFFSWNGAEDGVTPANKLAELQSMYDYLMEYKENGTLADNTAAFMVETLGLTENEVNAIKTILLEEVAQ